MVTRLASLALVLIIGGNVIAGSPWHSNEQECNLPGMAGMDCCKTAAQVSLTPEVSTARLCCALYCSQTGATGASESQLPRPSTNQVQAIYPPATQPPVPPLPFLLRSSVAAERPPPYSNPTYIRHLALLI